MNPVLYVELAALPNDQIDGVHPRAHGRRAILLIKNIS